MVQIKGAETPFSPKSMISMISLLYYKFVKILRYSGVFFNAAGCGGFGMSREIELSKYLRGGVPCTEFSELGKGCIDA